ncbi:hypothetical protein J4573_20805 [Actinomadura barringtoniae]|uniref:DUF2269 family protein n=1 Tax=Actinomadura barringtoniae TaxID=1427535 RepID=A0A939PI19_9ACTN|nr:hypothetical protein [Actinomadura barringtoniae]MBO2449554.1 hypothetical protein [Actinomadura barringtoniae]
MNKVLLSVHVLAAIIFIGPVTVAASMFPPLARRALEGDGDLGVLRTLHRISLGYAFGGIIVPVFGLAVALGMGVLGDTWLIISIVLTLVAALVLALKVIPDQAGLLAGMDGDEQARAALMPKAKALSMVTGMFALLWAVVVVLMIVRPGSSTGA